jgi:hypothetical protein
MMKTAGVKVRYAGKKYTKNELCFDEEGMEGRREMKETLRKFKEENDDSGKAENYRD